MTSNKDMELLSSASNCVVARHVGRRFPGILIQGDTLSTLVDDVDELIDECNSRDTESAKAIAKNIRSKLEDWLVHYERVLEVNGIDRPYAKSMHDRKRS